MNRTPARCICGHRRTEHIQEGRGAKGCYSSFCSCRRYLSTAPAALLRGVSQVERSRPRTRVSASRASRVA